MPICFFRCEKCRREFANRQDAVKCEQNHLVIKKVVIKSYGLQAVPYELIVTFSNGKKWVYIAEGFI